jgi:hypothetical protein
MSSVVLDNSSTSGAPNSSTLTANGARLGTGGISTTGTVFGGSDALNGGVFYRALTVSDAAPAAPATQTPFASTTYAIDEAGGGLNPNQLQKFVYADARVSGPQVIQQYEEGYYVPTATAFVAPALAVDTVFCNRALATTPLDWSATTHGTFTCAAAPVVVPAAGITAGSVVRIMLVGGSAAAFTAAAAGGAAVPVITVQVGATTAASTFTVTGGETGMIYNWEVLRS